MTKHLGISSLNERLSGIGYVPFWDLWSSECLSIDQIKNQMNEAGMHVAILKISIMQNAEFLQNLIDDGWYIGKMTYVMWATDLFIYGFSDPNFATMAKLWEPL